MTTLAIEVVAADGALAALAPEWEALWRRVPSATPFQSPAWLLPWWSVFGTRRPIAAVLRVGDRLAGLLPLYLLDEPPERKLLLIGAGTTDYLDLLLEPGLPPDAAKTLLHAALAHAARDAVTACDLTDLPPGSPLRTAPPPPGWREAWSMQQPCTVLVLPPAARRLEDFVREGRLRDLRLARNRATRLGGWGTETAGAESLQPLLAKLFRLHQGRWAERGEPGLFVDPRVRAFHRAAAPRLLAAGTLRLNVLRFGERIVAAYYALLAGADRVLFYLSGFDATHRRESPGTILMGAMIEQAMAEGRRELHLLRGSEAYKYDWGAVERMNASRRLLPPERR